MKIYSKDLRWFSLVFQKYSVLSEFVKYGHILGKGNNFRVNIIKDPLSQNAFL